MKALLLAAVMAIALTSGAQAQRMSNLTSARLVQICTSKDARDVEGCNAYIDGVADTVAFFQRLRPADGSKGAKLPGYICVPGPVTAAQLRQTVIDWFAKHRDQGQRQASGAVLRALDESYLCPGEPHRPASE